jgi:hypothetical protein
MQDFPFVVQSAMDKARTAANGLKALAATGLVPWNPDTVLRTFPPPVGQLEVPSFEALKAELLRQDAEEEERSQAVLTADDAEDEELAAAESARRDNWPRTSSDVTHVRSPMRSRLYSRMQQHPNKLEFQKMDPFDFENEVARLEVEGLVKQGYVKASVLSAQGKAGYKVKTASGQSGRVITIEDVREFREEKSTQIAKQKKRAQELQVGRQAKKVKLAQDAVEAETYLADMMEKVAAAFCTRWHSSMEYDGHCVHIVFALGQRVRE